MRPYKVINRFGSEAVHHTGSNPCPGSKNKQMQYSEDYNTKDMESAFIAGRLMYMEKIPYFDTFKDFHIWYKVTRNHEKMVQLQDESINDTK